MKKTAIFVAAMLALSGCKTLISADIFASDVRQVVATGEPMTTPMVIALEVSGSDGCAKAEEQLLPAIRDAYGAGDFIGCEDGESFDTFARFRVPAEIVHEIANEQTDSEQPIYIGAYATDGAETITIEFFMNRESMEAFRAAIPSEFSFYAKDAPEYRLSAKIANDLAGDIEVKVNDVFADGKPIQKGQTFTLTRRGEVNIALSNVSNAAFGGTDSWVMIAEIPAGE